MNRYKEAFVGIDTAKDRNAVAVAVGDREGKIRYLGEFDNTPDAVIKLVRKLTERYETIQFCYEAGPTGYGLHRQIIGLGHSWVGKPNGVKLHGSGLHAMSWVGADAAVSHRFSRKSKARDGRLGWYCTQCDPPR